MKKCIFITVFLNPDFFTMFEMFYDSIVKYGELDNVDIVVYTETAFEDLFPPNVKIFINDGIDSVDKACKSRLDVFKLGLGDTYDQILYLDTDIIVKGPLQKVFDVCQEDIVYAMEEGSLTDDDLYHGQAYFKKEEIDALDDKSTFNCGVMLYNTSPRIQKLFVDIHEDMENLPTTFVDQAFIVHRAIKSQCYNNKAFKNLVVCNDLNPKSKYVIHHFCGEPGYAVLKLETMKIYSRQLSFSDIPEIKKIIHKSKNDLGEQLSDLVGLATFARLSGCELHFILPSVTALDFSEIPNLFVYRSDKDVPKGTYKMMFKSNPSTTTSPYCVHATLLPHMPIDKIINAYYETACMMKLEHFNKVGLDEVVAIHVQIPATIKVDNFSKYFVYGENKSTVEQMKSDILQMKPDATFIDTSEEEVTNLFIMSHCKEIHQLTKYSAFSTIASFIGKNKLINEYLDTDTLLHAWSPTCASRDMSFFKHYYPAFDKVNI